MGTWGLNMSNYTELAKALRDPEYYRMVAGGLRDTLGRGVIGGALGAPVDITNMAMGALGVPVSQRPVMGSEWLGQKMQDAGVVSANRNPVAETLGAFIDPATLGSGVVKLGALGAPAMAGIFAGKGAKTADVVMLSKAEEMAKAGIPDAQIWKETGWALNTPDGMPRFEIPDDAAQIGVLTDLIKKRNAPISARRDEILARVKAEGRAPTNEEKFYVNNANMQMQAAAYRGEIGDVVGHPPLFNAYNNISNRDIDWGTVGGGAHGEWNDRAQSLGLSGGLFGEGAKSTALHELQHAIQQREGFARGGSPEMFDAGPMFSGKAKELAADLSQNLTGGISAKPQEIVAAIKYGDPRELAAISQKHGFGNIDDALKFLSAEDAKRTPFGQYQRLAGEAEARLTQSRMNLTPEQRLAQYPYDPAYFEQATGNRLADLIVRKDGGKAMSVPDNFAYRGEHLAPSREFGAPLHDVTGGGNFYPKDFYSPNGLHYYGDGSPYDIESYNAIMSAKGNPDATVTMYRAVPKTKTNAEKIAELESQKAEFLRRGKMPKNTNFSDGSKWYDWAYDELNRLKSLPETPANDIKTINKGDWVTLSKGYAKGHGESVLNGEYKIISKKVKAKDLWTNADSIHEFGYNPE